MKQFNYLIKLNNKRYKPKSRISLKPLCTSFISWKKSRNAFAKSTSKPDCEAVVLPEAMFLSLLPVRFNPPVKHLYDLYEVFWMITSFISMRNHIFFSKQASLINFLSVSFHFKINRKSTMASLTCRLIFERFDFHTKCRHQTTGIRLYNFYTVFLAYLSFLLTVVFLPFSSTFVSVWNSLFLFDHILHVTSQLRLPIIKILLISHVTIFMCFLYLLSKHEMDIFVIFLPSINASFFSLYSKFLSSKTRIITKCCAVCHYFVT